MNIDLEELAAIVELLDNTSFTDFRYEQGALKIAIRRGGFLSDDVEGEPALAVAPVLEGQPVNRGTVQARGVSAEAPSITPEAAEAAGSIIVKAPIMGTFYRTPKPGEPPFVQIGDRVDSATNLCVIEVMKLYNSIPAGMAGEVVAVFALDGELIEFDQPLFAIRG